MGFKKITVFLLLLSLCLEGSFSKEKGTKKGKKKGKQVYCPSQLSSEDLARVPANSTSNILNRLLVSYDPRIRPNFKGYYTCVEVIFTLRRQVGFYMMGVYAPTLLIVVLSWLSFWINPDASAARVPLGLGLGLGLGYDQVIMSQLLGLELGIGLELGLGLALMKCNKNVHIKIKLHFSKRIEAEKPKIASRGKAAGKSPAPRNNTVNGTGGTPLHCQHPTPEIRCKKVCTSKSDLRTNDFSIVGSLPRDFELSNFDCYGKPIDTGAGKSQSKNNKKPPPPKPVIPTAAKRIDLYSRALFPFSFLFFNVIYWSVYL
ncbi:unnamed protein product [Tetraodon nigroviridis]|uniref:(spotted green pufferfish) hypothetical protein n=1 Tax=Tetraodon nigroviridis TaxID=99883 RepID=Q4S3Z4_TETNG|nr:unnamed protein product [Tetraodon nigroviridis]